MKSLYSNISESIHKAEVMRSSTKVGHILCEHWTACLFHIHSNKQQRTITKIHIISNVSMVELPSKCTFPEWNWHIALGIQYMLAILHLFTTFISSLCDVRRVCMCVNADQNDCLGTTSKRITIRKSVSCRHQEHSTDSVYE